jgi:hypothetical protein
MRNKIPTSANIVGVVIFLAFVLFSGVARADFTKTIQVVPGVETNAVTTWYYSSCTTSLGIGTYTVNVAPAYGVLNFADLNDPIPGCPAGSPSLPATAAYYTWTDTTGTASSDYFQLYYELNGQLAEVIDVTVSLASSAPPPPPPPACTITSRTLETVSPANDDARTTIGVGEYVAVTTDAGSVTWTTSSGGTITKLITGADGKERCSIPKPSSAPIEGTEACLTAPYSNATTTVVATLGNGESCALPFTVEQPSGLIFQRLQAPPLREPGYGFDFRASFSLSMWSAVFVTPGDVSFKNIYISEHDKEPYRSDPWYDAPLYTTFNGTSAVFLACDFDHDFTLTGSKQGFWIFGDPEGHETPFALVETETTDYLSEYEYSKGQIQALSTSGTFVPTPGSLRSVLEVPWLAHHADLQELDRNACYKDVQCEFGGGCPATPSFIKHY